MKRITTLFFLLFSFVSLLIAKEEDTHYAAIIRIESDADLDQLEVEGVQILRRRDDLLLCYVPINPQGKKIKSFKGIRDVQKGRKAIPTMDKAREFFNAEAMNKGTELPRAYTGKNVVAGICDIGIDPLHINFYDKEGNNRIKRITQYKEGTGERIVLEGEEEYREWKTDDEDKNHASHVAGIMGGSCFETGYQGLASEVDLVISTSQLTDVGLLCGVEDILEYAKEKGKPAVINLSMANYIGPHDGSSLFSQYLDKIGQEAIVVMSSGNSGNNTDGLHYQFTPDRPELRFNLSNHQWTQFEMYGATQCWSRDATPMKVRLAIFDGNTKENIYFFPWQELDADNFFYLSSTGDTPEDIEFAKYYNGEFAFTGGVDSESGRYCITAEYNATTDIESKNGPWARYHLTIDLEGEPGNEVYVYADSQMTRLTSVPGYPSPNTTLSFSDLSSGYNLVSVGMYVNRLRPDEDPSSATPPGTVAPYSSYATLPDGRVMPHTVAPGWNVISSWSTPYLEAHPEAAEESVASIFANGRENHYIYGGGTSMSSPYVAGAIACWLEANPSLKIQDIQKLIADTNIKDVPHSTDPHNGQGFFNPYTALQDVVKTSATNIDSLTEDKSRLTFYGNTLTLWNPSGEEKIIDIYSLSGAKVMSIVANEGIFEIDLSSFPTGIYMANTTGASIKLIL